MDKGTHFLGQPMYGQLISLLDKSKILKISRERGGERYVKRFDAWQHLVIMLYAVIKRFDSLREIGVVMNITELGATEDMLEKIADSTFIFNGGYKTLTHEEVIEILKESL